MTHLEYMDHGAHEFAQMKQALMERGLRYLGSGCGRDVFMSKSGRYVYKIPRSYSGICQNQSEADMFRRKKLSARPHLTPEHFARCRLAPSGILVMEAVKPYSDVWSKLPNWAKDTCDGPQCGTNRAGEMVMYDYGFE